MEENTFLVNPCGFAPLSLSVPWQEGQAAPSCPSTQEQSERRDKVLQVSQSLSHFCVFCSPFVLPSHLCGALVFPRAAGQVPWLCLSAPAAVFSLGHGNISRCLPTQSVGFAEHIPVPHSPSHPSVPWHPFGARQWVSPSQGRGTGQPHKPPEMLRSKIYSCKCARSSTVTGQTDGGNTLRKSKPPGEMQSAGSHSAEQDSWAGELRENWAVLDAISTIQAGPQPHREKISNFPPCSCWWQKSSCLPRCFFLYPSLCSTPIPLTLMFLLTAMFCQDVALQKQTWTFLLILSASRLALGALVSPCHHPQLALTEWMAVVIMSCHTKLWAPVSPGQLAGRGDSTAPSALHPASASLSPLPHWHVES